MFYFINDIKISEDQYPNNKKDNCKHSVIMIFNFISKKPIIKGFQTRNFFNINKYIPAMLTCCFFDRLFNIVFGWTETNRTINNVFAHGNR